MKFYSVAIQVKAAEQYFLVVLFNMLCKVVLTFTSVHDSVSMTSTFLWCCTVD